VGETVDILLVDDLPDKLLALEAVLADLGENVVTARSGAEALHLVLRHDFAVILLDVQMPGMDGLEAAALIRRRPKSARTPIIFVTGYADDLRTTAGYSLGAVDYILTPVVPEVLRTKVKVFVDLYRMTREVRRQADERVALAEERSRRAAADRAAARSAFLAEVSRALSDSLDPDTTARAVARSAVPFVADLAGVTLPGQPWQTELAWADAPGEPVRAARLSGRDGPDDALRAAVEAALAGGRRATLTGLDLPLPAAADGAVPAARVRSAAVLPLRARGRTLGVLTLCGTGADPRPGPADLDLAEDLAARAAVALDNARLYNDVERADRQKNEFLSMLAHELRNPLAPLRNAVHIMRVREPADPALAAARDVIDRNVTHLTRLVDDLLDVSRITHGRIQLKAEPVELTAVVDQAAEVSGPLIARHRHRLAIARPPAPVWVRGDATRLTQVVANLLNNAAKYTEDGGRITVTVAADGADAVIRVRDTGIGLMPGMLERVFELFTQAERALDRSQGGLGVGLSLVRRLVELHGGRVTAASDGPGSGSEFAVRLPRLADAPAADRPAEDRPPAATPAGRRVLVVDDNADAADSLALLLRVGGHEVRLAYSGPDAVAAAGAFRPHVILLDIGLPGMDGYEVARRLRAGPAAGAVLAALTGYGQDEDRRRAAAAGFDHHFVKPVPPEAIQDLLAGVPA
jgi:signal transduction histidine kinase